VIGARPQRGRVRGIARPRTVAVGLLLWAGCGLSVATAQTLRVSVAISLRPAFAELAERFAQAHPGIEVRLNAGASGVLLQQVRRGAPADLYVSASPDEIDRLEREGLVRPSTRRTLASNRLIVVVPSGAEPPRRPTELGEPRFDRIAVGNPRTAPVGRYAEAALRSLGLAEALAPRLVFGENARQVLEYVRRGDVSAGLVYRSDASLFPHDVQPGPELPAGSHPPIVYETVVPAGAAEPDPALAFVDFVLSDPGREVLRRHGFGDPP